MNYSIKNTHGPFKINHYDICCTSPSHGCVLHACINYNTSWYVHMHFHYSQHSIAVTLVIDLVITTGGRTRARFKQIVYRLIQSYKFESHVSYGVFFLPGSLLSSISFIMSMCWLDGVCVSDSYSTASFKLRRCEAIGLRELVKISIHLQDDSVLLATYVVTQIESVS